MSTADNPRPVLGRDLSQALEVIIGAEAAARVSKVDLAGAWDAEVALTLTLIPTRAQLLRIMQALEQQE